MDNPKSRAARASGTWAPVARRTRPGTVAAKARPSENDWRTRWSPSSSSFRVVVAKPPQPDSPVQAEGLVPAAAEDPPGRDVRP